MRIDRNTKEDFLKGIKQRINDGSWGLDELSYLLDNNMKYHLNYEDIGVLLKDAFIYTYALAMEDGVLNELENDQLANFQRLAMEPVPKNRAQRQDIRNQIIFLTRRFELTHGIQENLQQQPKPNLKPKPIPVKKAAVLAPVLNPNIVPKNKELEENLENEFEPEPEPETVKERVNNVYYKYPRPKLTPYNYY